MSGRGTAGGVDFQAVIGAFAGALMLTERPMARLDAGLPSAPRRILFETPSAVDDVIIETADDGVIYVQAKRTISLSEPEPAGKAEASDSDLASVADQFVRQYRQGKIIDGARRDLSPGHDRLILAVSDDTAGPIADHLREGLERRATMAATAMPAQVARALDIWTRQLDTMWRKAVGGAPTQAQLDAMLDLCRVIVLGAPHQQLAAEILRDAVAAPGDEGALLSDLNKWATVASAKGTGATLATLRQALAGGVKLAAPPSFRGDVDRLRVYSAATRQQIARFGRLRTPDGDVVVERRVTAVVAAAAGGGSLLITGEPGAGKSAVLHALAEQLALAAPVIMLSVDAAVSSLDGLRREIGLDNAVERVIGHMGDGRGGYLLIDALDAARGGGAETAYRRLMAAVSGLDGWRVVASVRSFDLRMGRQLQEGFAGDPPDPTYAEAAFSKVRHVHVPLLSPEETADLSVKAPSIAAALEVAGEKLQVLTRNAFNMALLGDLLSTGVSSHSLAGVASRGQLLERYWIERLDDLGLRAEATLARLVEAMLDARGTDLSAVSLDPSWADLVEECVRRGVLVTDAGRRVAFRHHVLFDYAVARLALSPDPSKALARLGRAAGSGLLLAPSLGFWLEERLRLDDPPAFWRFAQTLLGGADIDPVAKVESGRLVAELVTVFATLEPLAKAALADPEGEAGSAVIHLIGSVMARLSADSPTPPEPWARLSAALQPPPRRLIFTVQNLVSALTLSPPGPETGAALGLAARGLFDAAVTADGLPGGLGAALVPLVVRTYRSDPAGSRERLLTIFEPARFARLGFVEAPALAREVSTLIAVDLDMAIEVYVRVFSAEGFSRDQKTSMGGGWIMSLTSNAAQDFESAKYSLGEAFPTLLEADPGKAATMLAAIFEAEHLRENRRSEPVPSYAFEVDGQPYVLVEDLSFIWAWDAEDDAHDEYAKMLRAYLNWTKTSQPDALLAGYGDLLAAAKTGLTWRLALTAASLRPEVLGPLAWPLAAQPSLLQGRDTGRAAIMAVAALYPFLQAKDREAFEAAAPVMDMAGAIDADRDRRELCAKIFAAIGEAELATAEARDLLRTARADGVSLANDREVEFIFTSRDLEPHEWIEREGKDPSLGPDAEALRLADALDAVLEAAQSDGGDLDAVASATDTLRALLATSDLVLVTDVSRTAYDAVARGVRRLVGGYRLDDPRRPDRLRQLLALSEHPLPAGSPAIEESFAASPHWGTPCPRIRAAEGLAGLIGVAQDWPVIAAAIERLALNDAHPAVRMMVVRCLGRLWPLEPDQTWRLVESVVAQEANPAVLRYVSGPVGVLSGADAQRAFGLVADILRRVAVGARDDGALMQLLGHLAFAKALPQAKTLVESWLTNPEGHDKQLRGLLVQMRYVLTGGYDDPDAARTDGRAATRGRVQAYVLALAQACAPSIEGWIARGGEPTPGEIEAVKLVDFLADELFFGVGAAGRNEKLSIVSKAGQRRFLDDMTPLIGDLGAKGTPHAVHHLLQLLAGLVEADPGTVFDLVAGALLRPGGVAKYEHEPLGAPHFVKLIGVFLADHRELFEDEARRRLLIDCIAVFVDAGWPEARRLLQSLPELLA